MATGNKYTLSIRSVRVAAGTVGTGSGIESYVLGTGAATNNNALALGGGTASGSPSIVIGASAGTASGNNSTAIGTNTNATAGSAIAIGNNVTAGGTNAVALGYNGSAPRAGQFGYSATNFVAIGDCQANKFVVGLNSTTATPTIMTFDQNPSAVLTGVGTNVLTIPVNKAHRFTINAVARRTDSTSDAGGWTITGTIVRGASGNAVFASTPSVVSDLTAGATSGLWSLAVTIDTSNATNNYLVITATGQTGATIRWVADIATAEAG